MVELVIKIPKAVLAEALETGTIEGFSDLKIQDKKYANRLAYARAYTAKEYLVKKGIDDSRISIEGLGSEQAICFQDKCQGVNRRIQLEIYKP